MKACFEHHFVDYKSCLVPKVLFFTFTQQVPTNFAIILNNNKLTIFYGEKIRHIATHLFYKKKEKLHEIFTVIEVHHKRIHKKVIVAADNKQRKSKA